MSGMRPALTPPAWAEISGAAGITGADALAIQEIHDGRDPGVVSGFEMGAVIRTRK